MVKLTTKLLVESLRKVPEKTFRISELAPGLIDENGKVNLDKALNQADEIDSAVGEVEGYIKATRSITSSLRGTKGTSEGFGGDEMGMEDELD